MARDLAVHRARYPALRDAPAGRRRAVEALAEAGFDPHELEGLEREYDDASPRLFASLLERAREAQPHPELMAKFEGGELPRHEGMKLLYLGIRVVRPPLVVETGTYAGTLSTIALAALTANASGHLVSLDLPAYQAIPHAVDAPLPANADPGWIVPDELRERLTLVLGDARATLPQVLAREHGLGVFVHDSLHTMRHMLFEYRLAWRHLVPGGLLISDDVFMTPAFWLFAKLRRHPFRHTGTFGVLRKPS